MMAKYGLCAALLLTLLAGCGKKSAGPEVAEVSGKLTKKEGTPVADALIEFLPTKGTSSTAKTDAEGNFKLICGDGTPGAIVGTHAVRVTIGGGQMGTANGDSPPPAKPPAPPTLYVMPDQTVSSGPNTLQLTLPEKGQQG